MQLTVPNFELDCCGLRVSGSIRLSGGLGSTEWARFDGLGSMVRLSGLDSTGLYSMGSIGWAGLNAIGSLNWKLMLYI